ncbi:MAG TPA: helix-turn-helix domain-containing protein [Jatrophihabitans sp.]|uniref:helix-turn-helix domain-containing protein n=1 Tax=Jatrophihabitans sp. TaxID=1932789 RepID=UPI002EE63CE5
MSRMSVPEAAAELGVSVARIRQRIDEGSLVAEKVGGRWLVDLASSGSADRPQRGRPVHPEAVWYSLLALQRAAQVDLPKIDLPKIDLPKIDLLSQDLIAEAKKISPASRHRAVARLSAAITREDHDAILSWLRNRGERRVYKAAMADLQPLRDDNRLLPSGLSHPDSGMSDPRVAEGYVAAADIHAVAADHWLERPSIDERPNVFVHIVPALPSRIGALLLAADLAEHEGPRERRRAHELLDIAIGAGV